MKIKNTFEKNFLNNKNILVTGASKGKGKENEGKYGGFNEGGSEHRIKVSEPIKISVCGSATNKGFRSQAAVPFRSCRLQDGGGASA